VYLIVGLGNPEEEYANTRHNIGFDVINELAKNNKIEIDRKKYNSLYGQGNIKGEKVILLKPQTYMNLSGVAVRDFKKFFKIEDNKVIIIHDDIDIDVGKVKIRKIGGAGTHNGMKSVVQELGGKDFYRVRMGIGKPFITQDLKDFVLEKIDKETRQILDEAVCTATKAIEDIMINGIDHAMNQYN